MPEVVLKIDFGNGSWRDCEPEYESNKKGTIISMSNKIGRKKEQSISDGLEIVGQIIEYLVATVVIAVCIAVPFYAKDGYHQIGNAKFAVYKSIMTVGLAVLLGMAVFYLFFWLKEKKKWHISVTDALVAAYLILSGVSVISGGFYEDALWGCPGWNMGLMSQISFVLLYLFLSRFGRYYRGIVTVLCSVAAVVFLIGILHRMMIDPLGFYDGLENYQKAQFLSTLGQATWYASFLAVVLPVGVAVFLYAQNNILRILSGIFMMLGFCSLVTQNSDSAYFAMAGFMLVFLWTSVDKWECFNRFLWVCTLFFLAGKLMYYLLRMNPNPALEYDVITEFVLCSAGSWSLLVIFLVASVVVRIRGGKSYPVGLMSRLRRGIVPAAGILIVATIVLIVLQTKDLLPDIIAGKLETIAYFNWNDSWGNGRGRTWSFTVWMYKQENLIHKLFGVGPDCFCSYMSAHYREEMQILWGERLLTNAHNEWLNTLICTGLFGVTAYIGIFVTAVYRFLRGASRNPVLTGIAAAVVSYMAYNFFCYQQVLCTPFVFILIGIGEYMQTVRGNDPAINV